MKLKFQSALLGLIALNSPVVFSQDILDLSVKRNERPVNFSTDISIGLGSFQDIQLPLNPLSGQRGNGTSEKEENQVHSGFPIVGSLTMENNFSILNFETELSFVHMSINKQSQPVSTASYGRYEAEQLVGLKFFNSQFSGSLLGGISTRRSLFSNISTGHSFDSQLAKGQLKFDYYRYFNVKLIASKSLNSKFNYNQGSFFNQKEIQGSNSEIQEFEVKVGVPLNKKVSLFANFSQERVHAVIPDIGSYGEFGIDILTFATESREYNLTTNIYSFGLKKYF